MDYLQQAKHTADSILLPFEQGTVVEPVLATAYALIAICERLDRIIESQVLRVPITGTLRSDAKIAEAD